LIVDPIEAYVLETADKWWVAERITKGPRNISNNVSIQTNHVLVSEGIDNYPNAVKTDGKFNFYKTFARIPTASWFPTQRERIVAEMLTSENLESKKEPEFVKYLMSILREHKNGVCFHTEDFLSTCGMVSRLSTNPNETIHWITGSPYTCTSCFKSFQFGDVMKDSFDLENTKPESMWFIHAKMEGKKHLLKNLEDNIISQSFANVGKASGSKVFLQHCEKEMSLLKQ